MQTDIFIVGAGLAGLSLATGLKRKGIDFILAEARDRVGGRILSTAICKGENAACRADLGPSWIWPGQPLVEALLDDLGIRTFEQYSTGLLVYEDELGQVRRDLDYAPMAGSLRVEGGIANLTEHLLANLDNSRIRLSHRVSSVRRNAEAYQINLDSPDGEIQIEARQLVFAIPPRLVAANIDFEPELPATVIQEMHSIPTWMAGQAKLFAIYETPFWREQGLSGDGMSRRGPLMEIHDASPANATCGVLFGFVGPAASSEQREPANLKTAAVEQLEKMFGHDAARPIDVILQDWSLEEFTAIGADQVTSGHPRYGIPQGMATLAEDGLLFASSEMAAQFGGLLEGALEASHIVLAQLRL